MAALFFVLLALKWIIQAYVVVLWARLILDWVRVFNPSFRPKGILIALTEFVYTVTDPPIKLVRRVLPPIRLGQVAIDLGWMITIFACFLALALIPV